MNEQELYQEQRPSWWQRNWKWFVPTGCLTLIALFIGFIAFVFFSVTSMMKESEPYMTAFTETLKNEYVIEQLGEPIEPKTLVEGEISFKNSNGKADFRIPLEGPKGTADLHVIGTKTDGEWTYSKMEVRFTNGDTVDLLENLNE